MLCLKKIKKISTSANTPPRNLEPSVYPPCPGSVHNVQTGRVGWGVGGAEWDTPSDPRRAAHYKGREDLSRVNRLEFQKQEYSTEQEVLLMNSTGFSARAHLMTNTCRGEVEEYTQIRWADYLNGFNKSCSFLFYLNSLCIFYECRKETQANTSLLGR